MGQFLVSEVPRLRPAACGSLRRQLFGRGSRAWWVAQLEVKGFGLTDEVVAFRGEGSGSGV